jgi:ABC-type phosphate transport system permease subunit
MDRRPAQRVELVVSARTLVVLLAVGAIVALEWDDLTNSAGFQNIVSTAGADDSVRNALKNLAAGLPDAATTVIGIAGGVFGSLLSLILAVPFAAVIKIVLRKAGAPRRARMAALR